MWCSALRRLWAFSLDLSQRSCRGGSLPRGSYRSIEGRGSWLGESQAPRLRTCLVAGEIALALVLLNGAGLLIGTVVRLQNFDPGLDARNVTVAQFHLTGPRYRAMRPAGRSTCAMLSPQYNVLRALLAGCGAYLAWRALPLRRVFRWDRCPGPRTCASALAGASEADGELAPSKYTPVTADYFEAIRIPLRKGRYIDEHDTGSAQWVAVVNETFARQFFPKARRSGK